MVVADSVDITVIGAVVYAVIVVVVVVVLFWFNCRLRCML